MKDFIDFLKLPPTILSAISISTGCALFLPTAWLGKMGLSSMGPPYLQIVAIVFLLSSALLLVYAVIKLYKWLENIYYKRKIPKAFAKAMEQLSNEELNVVMAIYSTPDKTRELPINNGLTLRLESKLIIQKTGRAFFVGPGLEIPYTLTPRTVKFIDEQLAHENGQH